MQITNTSARIVFMQITEKLVSILPLQTITLTGNDATEATAVVSGPLKPLVLSGELIVLREADDPPLPEVEVEPEPEAEPEPEPECVPPQEGEGTARSRAGRTSRGGRA